MKKRIWNQLKKAVMVTVLAGIIGNCAVSATEFEAQEPETQEILLQQSAEWTDEENFQAEIGLEVSGLKELYKKTQNMDEGENVQEQKMAESGSETDLEEENGEETNIIRTDGNTADGSEDAVKEISENELADEIGEQQGENAQTEQNNQQTGEEQPNQDKLSDEKYFLTAYISEYFQVNESGLKHDMQAESVRIRDQKGEATEITRLTCEVPKMDENTDTFTLRIPISLRAEYRISPVAVSYPVCQDSPLNKDQETAGAYFWVKTEEESRVLSASVSAVLSVVEAKTGITAELQQSATEVRAGQTVPYVLEVKNTGKLSLENIEISSAFSIKDINAEWESEDNFAASGMRGILKVLQPGESRTLRMTAKLTESQSGELIHTVTVKTKHPGKDENIGCQTSAKLKAVELKTAFEVEKTADRTEAYPGDTITYQICIRNTGERTLHSVLSTERFQNAGIQAKFVQKEGVTINSSGTQAMIPQIAPGEAFALYATVTIPQYLSDQELVNEVTVVTEETGSQTMKSQSNVTLTTNENTVTATPQPTEMALQTYGGDAGYASKSADSYAVASKPRTGDETEIEMYFVLAIFAMISGLVVFIYKKGTKSH